MRRIKRKKKINTSISFMENANFVNILSKKEEKVIISIRNFKSRGSKGFYGIINKFFMRLLYNKADHIVAVSQLIKKDLIDNFKVKPEKIKVIYNSYSTEKINLYAQEPIENKFNSFFQNPVIVNVGRLEEQKGHVHLIKAFLEVKRNISNAKLLIVGSGSLEHKIKKLVKKMGLNEDVQFIDYTTNPFKYVYRSDLFVLSSLYEGFPNALCEAMACGLPVISTDCKSGPREILTDNKNIYYETEDIEFADYGVLVPVCSSTNLDEEITLSKEEKLLAKSIIKLLSDETLLEKYRSQSKKRVKEFSIESTIKKWEEIV